MHLCYDIMKDDSIVIKAPLIKIHRTRAATNPLNFELNQTFELELTASNIHYILSCSLVKKK